MKDRHFIIPIFCFVEWSIYLYILLSNYHFTCVYRARCTRCDHIVLKTLIHKHSYSTNVCIYFCTQVLWDLGPILHLMCMLTSSKPEEQIQCCTGTKFLNSLLCCHSDKRIHSLARGGHCSRLWKINRIVIDKEKTNLWLCKQLLHMKSCETIYHR